MEGNLKMVSLKSSSRVFEVWMRECIDEVVKYGSMEISSSCLIASMRIWSVLLK